MTETAVHLSKNRAVELEKRLRTLSYEDSHSIPTDLTTKHRAQTASASTNSHQCPYEGLQSTEKFPLTNLSCVPYKKTEGDCNEAFKYFGEYNITSAPLQCERSASRPICTFLTESRVSSRDKVSVTCWRDVCSKSSPILLGCSDAEFGIVDEEKNWLKFHSVGELEQELPGIVTQNSINGFNSCLLKCKMGTTKVKQALIFPPILKPAAKKAPPSKIKKINVNIVLEDSVSRSHFYRYMPRSVQSLRDIYRDSSFQATVLDFELVQSYAAFTLPNVQFLMAGKSLQGNGKSPKRLNGISVLTERFKRFGYQTLMHEDLCWFDQWGSFFSPAYKKKLKPFTEEFKRVYESFKHANDPYVDNKGLMFLSCEILRDLGASNPFGGNFKNNCWDGRSMSEYLLFYVRRFLSLVDRTADVAPALVYTHLNTGHEPSGKRIRSDDIVLSRFLEEMARSDNTLSIILSDHGGKTTDYAIETLPGSLEVFSPMLFMIIPHKVAQRLGKDRMDALILNQKRLVTVSDLHHTLTSIAALTDGELTNGQVSGLFQPVSTTRTCADIKGLNSEAMCRCEGWRKFLSPKSLDVIWLAEFALGQINNMIQAQYLQGLGRYEAKRNSGYGHCARYVGKAIERPQQKLVGKHYMTTLVLVVEPAYGAKSKERFEVQLNHSSVREHNITLIKYTRLSFYSKYKSCVDKHVDVQLCACAVHHSNKRDKRGGSAVENLIRARHFVDYGMKSTTRFLESKCLLVTIRYVKMLVISKKQTRLMSIEVANVCKDSTLRVKLGGIHRVTRFSRALPVTLVVKPRTIHFVIAVLNGWKYGLFRPVFVHAPISKNRKKFT
ncbi:hypothetical protein OS493_013212 [Desmophyllum pertusum]|uniref:Uncharacterized protein n=1 Tax=Desmophyllum pertusum TaxID=174260 RepID=A0A9X0CLH9_9CNID|nr:hypothetical protein OS493_013212 [Desmophyllum pertusum]